MGGSRLKTPGTRYFKGCVVFEKLHKKLFPQIEKKNLSKVITAIFECIIGARAITLPYITLEFVHFLFPPSTVGFRLAMYKFQHTCGRGDVVQKNMCMETSS